jgi:hypothetical protein
MATSIAESTQANTRHKVRSWTTGVKVLGFKPESRAESAGVRKGDVITRYGDETNLTSDRLLAVAGEALLRGASVEVVFLRGDDEHSVTLPPGPLGIKAMDIRAEGPFESEADQVSIDKTILWIQRLYLFFAVLAMVVLLSAVSHSNKNIEIVLARLGTGPIALLYLFIYFGLRIRMAHTGILILFVSSFNCLGCFFLLMSLPAHNLGDLCGKVWIFLFFLFFAYQILFFRRAEVRALFKDGGTTVI